jgi:hypothetical protein
MLMSTPDSAEPPTPQYMPLGVFHRKPAPGRAAAGLSPRGFTAAVCLVVVVAMALAATWAIRAPFFLQPDERAHLDYAFGFFDAGRPFRTRPATPGMGITAQEHYIDARIGFRRLRYDPTARVRSDYGSPAFVADFDAHAPRPSGRVPQPGSRLPYISFLYPALYYALVASTMRIADALTHGSLWRDLLAARAMGVLLLGLTLVVAARVFRMVRFSRLQTVLALICVGWFPLTSWVAGYVQPDNLSFTLVTLALWLGLRWKKWGRLSDAVALSASLGLLFLTKQHYGLCCWLGVLILAVPRLLAGRVQNAVATGAVLAVPPALCFKASFLATYSPGLASAASSFSKVGSTLSLDHLRDLVAGYVVGIISAFFGGPSFTDYWSRFGERGETLFPGTLGSVVRLVILVVMLVLFTLVAAYQLRVVRRIARVIRYRSVLTGLGLATGSLFWNVYVLIGLLLLFVFVQSNEAIWIEGRYWLPLIVPMIVLSARFANGFSTRLRPALRYGFLGALAAFCLFSSANGIAAIDREYYRAPAQGLDYVPLARLFDVGRSGIAESIGGPVPLRRGGDLDVHGFAVDPRTGFAARTVFARVDAGTARRPATVGLACSFVADAYSDDRLGNSCFVLHLRSSDFAPGLHRLRLYVADPGYAALPIHDELLLRVT